MAPKTKFFTAPGEGSSNM
jgi:hypothetical protein